MQFLCFILHTTRGSFVKFFVCCACDIKNFAKLRIIVAQQIQNKIIYKHNKLKYLIKILNIKLLIYCFFVQLVKFKRCRTKDKTYRSTLHSLFTTTCLLLFFCRVDFNKNGLTFTAYIICNLREKNFFYPFCFCHPTFLVRHTAKNCLLHHG